MTTETGAPSGVRHVAVSRGWLARARAAATGLWAMLRRHRFAAGGAGILVLGLLGYALLAGGGQADSGYVTAIVQRGNIENTVTALGNLQPVNYVDVGAQASGQLMKLDVELGDRVKKGQLIAEIDPRVLRAKVDTDKSNLANLKAQLADKKAQLALAQANFARQQRLLKADATSHSDYDSALQALRSAAAQGKALDAQIAAAQSQLSGDEVTLGYTNIYAPMDGTVVSITAKQGQMLNANQQAPIILRIANLSTMEVDTQVSEADVSKLRVGMPAYFTTLGEPDKRWTGTLTQIQPTPDVVNNVVLYTATFDVQNPKHQLMTQMTAQVFFVTASAKNALIVPVAALHELRARRSAEAADTTPSSETANAARRQHAKRSHGDRAPLPPGAKRYWVAVVAPNGSMERRRVVAGVSNRVSAEILSGLKQGERVIVGQADNNADEGAGAADRQRVRRFRHFGGLH